VPHALHVLTRLQDFAESSRSRAIDRESKYTLYTLPHIRWKAKKPVAVSGLGRFCGTHQVFRCEQVSAIWATDKQSVARQMLSLQSDRHSPLEAYHDKLRLIRESRSFWPRSKIALYSTSNVYPSHSPRQVV